MSTDQDSAGPGKNLGGDQERLRESFKYLYKTYFGETQIEKDEIKRLPDLLSDCDVFIDVGASLGMYTYFANKLMQNCVIYSIEADPDRFAELEKNCAEWQEQARNRLVPVFAAAGDTDGSVSFYKTGSHISGSVFAIPERADRFEQVQVPQIMLDDFFEKGKKFFIKIDVEGAEYRVLSGAKHLLESGQADLAVGIHSWGDRDHGKTPMSVLGYMLKKRMAVFKTSNRMTANYLFTPARGSALCLYVGYLRYAPALLLRQTYRRYMPRKLARTVERRLNAARRRAILD
jgi:FkbM family methyltransferase